MTKDEYSLVHGLFAAYPPTFAGSQHVVEGEDLSS